MSYAYLLYNIIIILHSTITTPWYKIYYTLAFFKEVDFATSGAMVLNFAMVLVLLAVEV